MPFKKGHKINLGRKQTKKHIAKCRVPKIGKKKPEHSKLMKKLAIEGKFQVLTNRTLEQNKNISIKAKERIKNNGHPKGMLGKKQSEANKKIMADNLKKAREDPNNRLNSKEYRQMLSDRASKLQQTGVMRNRYSNTRIGTYDINGKDYFFRSAWEANYALYLDFLIKQKEIKKWEYEKDTFWFEKIRRGVRSYKPDFKVFNNNGSIEYHEVKGWMDSKSKTKLKRMDKYYPEVKLILIDAPVYRDIKNKVGGLLKFY